MPSTTDFLSQSAPVSITQWATATPYAIDQYVEEGIKLYRCTLAHTSSALFATDVANWVEVSPSDPLAIILDSSGGAVTETLPAATGLGVTRKYVIADKTNTITFGVQAGESLNEVVDASYLASNHGVGTEFELCDYATGKWSIAVVGAATSVSLARYSVRGVAANISLVNGPNILPIGSLVDSDLVSSGISVASEYDPLGWRTANQITVSKTGRYRVDVQVVHTAANLSGADNQSTSGSSRSGIRINGTSVEWTGIDDTAGLADQTSGFFVRQFSAGDEIDVVVNATSTQTGEDFYVSFAMEELPSTETILAGHVVPTPLHYLELNRSNVPTSGSSTDFTVGGRVGGGTGKWVLGASVGATSDLVNGTIAVQQAGTYLISIALNHYAAGGSATFALRKNGVQLIPIYVEGGATAGSDDISWSVEHIAVLAAGDVIDLLCSSSSMNNRYFGAGSFFIVRQLPTSTVVDPGDVPVVDLAWGMNYWSSIGSMTNSSSVIAVTATSSRATLAPASQRIPMIGTGNPASGVFTGSGITRDTTNNQLVIQSGGRYSVTADTIGGWIGGVEHGIQLVLNGATVLAMSTSHVSGQTFSVGAKISWEGVLAANDTLELRAWVQGVGTPYYFEGGTFIVAQQPSHSIVKYNPGDVEVQNLHYGSISGASSFTATANTVIPTSAWTTNGNSFGLAVSEAAGTITIAQAGTYRVVASAVNRSTSNTANNSMAIAKNGVVVYTSPIHTAGNAGAFPLPIRAEEVLTLSAGDVITAFTGEINGVSWGAPYLSVSQEPIGVLVSLDDVPVVSLDSAKISQAAAGQTIADNSGATLITFDTVSFDKNSNLADVANDRIVIATDGWYQATAQVRFDTPSAAGRIEVVISYNAGSIARQKMVVSSINGSDEAGFNLSSPVVQMFAGDTLAVRVVNNSGVTITLNGGVDEAWLSVNKVAEYSVVRPEDTVVNDQSASGYFDVGPVRYQWGRGSAGNGGALTLPAPFANNTYVVTPTFEQDANIYVGVLARTTTQFTLISRVPQTGGPGGSIIIGFIAIGLKP